MCDWVVGWLEKKNDVRPEWDADRMTSVTMAFDFVASSDDGLGLGEAVGS
jgi:hypothetical protein